MEIHRTVWQLIRQDDEEGIGLKNIFISRNEVLMYMYFRPETVLTIPPCVLRSEDLKLRWLEAVFNFVRHNFKYKNHRRAGRFDFSLMRKANGLLRFILQICTGPTKNV